MDPLQLLADLEGLRDKIPAALRADFEDLIANIRNIYEMSIKFITPPQPVRDGKQNLASHHTTVDGLCTQLENSLAAFQMVYTGSGSDAYHLTAATSLQNLQLIRDHLATASQLHDTMAVNFDTATEAQIALVALLVGLSVTLGILIFSAGAAAFGAIPAAAFEVVGGLASMGLITDAEAAAVTAILSLMWSALPSALLSGLLAAAATDILGNIILHPVTITSIGQNVHPIVTNVPQEAQLPEPRLLTGDEENEVQKIVAEIKAMGINVNAAWIEYLMRILGAKMTAQQAASVIRCMFNKGYMPKITAGQESRASKIQNSLSKVWNNLGHLTQRDLEGAWKDVHPDKVDYPPGELPSRAQHLAEVRNALQSLANLQEELLDVLTDPTTPENLQKIYQNLYDACEATRNYVAGKIYGSDPPLTWSDPKGEIPFGDDLISKSGCL